MAMTALLPSSPPIWRWNEALSGDSVSNFEWGNSVEPPPSWTCGGERCCLVFSSRAQNYLCVPFPCDLCVQTKWRQNVPTWLNKMFTSKVPYEGKAASSVTLHFVFDFSQTCHGHTGLLQKSQRWVSLPFITFVICWSLWTTAIWGIRPRYKLI